MIVNIILFAVGWCRLNSGAHQGYRNEHLSFITQMSIYSVIVFEQIIQNYLSENSSESVNDEIGFVFL